MKKIHADRLTARTIIKAFRHSNDKTDFLNNGIWLLSARSMHKSWFAMFILLVTPLVQLYIRENVMRKAADLTYSTIMSIVPILAIIFAIAKGFGMEGIMWQEIVKIIGDGNLMDQVLMSVSKSVEIAKADSGWIFVVALLSLVVTSNNALVKLEDIFNELWNVESRKGWFGRLPYNIFFLFSLPVGIFILGAITGHVESLVSTYLGFSDWIIRSVVASAILTVMYRFLPYTQVEWRGAIISGVVAGIVLTFWHAIYLVNQNLLFNYNKVYGSFAAIPFFLIWTLVSWYIVLGGAQLNMVIQNSVFTKGWTGYDRDKIVNMSSRDKMLILISVASATVRSFIAEQEITLKRIVAVTRLSDTYVSYALDELERLGIIHHLQADKGINTYYPSLVVENLTVGQLISKLSVRGSNDAIDECAGVGDYLDDILVHVENDADLLLKNINLRE